MSLLIQFCQTLMLPVRIEGRKPRALDTVCQLLKHHTNIKDSVMRNAFDYSLTSNYRHFAIVFGYLVIIGCH